mgnify:CR=1 FL=1
MTPAHTYAGNWDFDPLFESEYVNMVEATKIIDESTREPHVLQEIVDKILAGFPPGG